MQASQGVNPLYRIKTQQIVAPNSPRQQLSSKLRPLVALLAIGAILLLLGISAAEALHTLRAEWRQRDLPKSEGKRDSIEGMANGNGQLDGEDLSVEDEMRDSVLGTATSNTAIKRQSRKRQRRKRKTASNA